MSRSGPRGDDGGSAVCVPELDEPAPQTVPSIGSGRHNLVYTSAGDHHNVHQWVADRPDFDVWVTYYGERADPELPPVQRLDRSKGSKFQNLHRVWRRQRRTLASYEKVFVLDDDIRLSTGSINRLFRCLDETGVRVLQPAFDPRGKISHPITRARAGTRFRRVDFVEVGVALFRAEHLWRFLEVYDPRLPCMGIDWWYSAHLGLARDGGAAIVDEIVCLNPHDESKGGRREIDRLITDADRRAVWAELREQLGSSVEGLGCTVYERSRLRGPEYCASVARISLWRLLALVGRVRRRARRGCKLRSG